MIVCCKCQVKMNCHKNGVGANFGNGHVYMSDRMECPVCKRHVLVTSKVPLVDPEYQTCDEYLTMKEVPELK